MGKITLIEAKDTKKWQKTTHKKLTQKSIANQVESPLI